MLFLETYLPRSRRGWFRHSFRTSEFFVYFYFTFLKKCHMRWKPRMMGSFCTIGCFHLISGCKVMTLSRHFPTLIGLVEFVTPLFALLGFFALLGLKATVARDGTLQTPIAKTSRRGTFTTNPYYMIWVPRLGTYPPFLVPRLGTYYYPHPFLPSLGGTCRPSKGRAVPWRDGKKGWGY